MLTPRSAICSRSVASLSELVTKRENSAAEAIDRDLVLFDRAIGLDASVGQFGVALGECPYAGAEEGFDPTAHHDQLYTQAPNVILVFSVNAHLLSHDR
jgi:hypothetical protein